ncbi:hypothetical protein [Aequorivita vladivostokensis]|uniref:Uncharacterized protein n=1 Tax=Aequorivita vladivostokensis TaxID=171194 RepID=A0ABR5DJG7_9FLAO|nr:hypothetical protein [Aequorivita vladivostokensis]KJJ38919.1 hypothetical protein MB09_05625 [Aequorivita vladivostokensis]
MTKYKSFLKIEKTVSLPVAVETNAVLVSWKESLFILTNSIAKRETFVFKMSYSFTFEKIKTLPILSTSAYIFESQIIISGSDNEGNAIIVAINFSGEILQKIPLEITPSIWPKVGGTDKIYVAWQEKADEIKRGILNFNNSEIEQLQPIPVENPPAKLIAVTKTLFAIILEKNKTIVIDLITNEQHSLNISQSITVGQSNEDIYFGWMESNTVCLKFQHSEEKHCVASKNANTGKLQAVSGSEAALWLQKQEMDIDGNYQWKSAIIQKDVEIFEIDSFIHTVGAWNGMLVAVQESKIIFLKKQTI